MIGVYRIPEEHFFEQNRKGIIKSVYIVLLMLAFFGAGILTVDGTAGIEAVIVFTIIIASLSGIVFLIAAFQKFPINNTVIEITENKIIRTGDKLLTVRMNYDQIDRVLEQNNGTLILQKGTNLFLKSLTNRYIYENEFGVIYIPSTIDNYELICGYIRRKTV